MYYQVQLMKCSTRYNASKVQLEARCSLGRLGSKVHVEDVDLRVRRIMINMALVAARGAKGAFKIIIVIMMVIGSDPYD